MKSRRTARTAEVRAVSLLTSRAGILSATILAALITLAIPVKQLLDQQTRINDLRDRQAANILLIEKLQQDVDRWQDPAYVRAQARSRLHYVMPHEIGYIVLEADDVAAVTTVNTTMNGTKTAWYTTMWNSLEDAGKTSPPLLVSVDN